MASSQGVNVLRWGALVCGIFYGFSHQGLINSRDRAYAAKHEYDQKLKLIDEAKLEWKRKTSPPTQGDGVVTNPDDPKFDLEAYLTKVAKESS